VTNNNKVIFEDSGRIHDVILFEHALQFVTIMNTMHVQIAYLFYIKVDTAATAVELLNVLPLKLNLSK